MAVPIGVALLFLMGVGPALPWGRGNARAVSRRCSPPLAAAVVFGSSASIAPLAVDA